MNNELKNEIQSLIENAKVAYVSSVDGNGYPNTKAMLSLKHDGMRTFYFSTNYSTKRREQFMNNSHSNIYFCDEKDFKGAMLIGEMEVCTDRKHREMLWFDGAEVYYPKGIDDDDYCVFQFTASWGNYYHGLNNTTFRIEELDGPVI
jgi:general stress protein 26